CASCHKPDKDMTGPALKGARQRWIDNSSEENLYDWVKNSGAVIASGDAYANSLFSKWNKSVMNPQPVSNEQIDLILEYADTYTPAISSTGGPGTVGVTANDEESSSWFWWLLAGLLLVVVFTVGGVKGSL